MDNIDLDNLTTVKKASVAKQDYDVRFSHASETFQLSDRFYANKGMNSNGFTFHLANNGQVPLLSIRPNEESVFYKGKEGSDQKGTNFSYGILQTGLEDLDILDADKEKGFTNFDLEFIKEKDGADFYLIKAKDAEVAEEGEEQETEETSPEGDPEVAPAPEAEEAEEADEHAEEEEEDPFDI